jgi:Tfp pilus assembly protein PilN
MANVNLISARRAERIRLTRVTKALLIAVIGASSVGGFATVFMFGKLWQAQSQINAADQELSKLRPVIQQIESQEAERAGLQPKLATLTDAQTRTGRWTGIMDGLKRAIPRETWLTNVSVEKQGETGHLMRMNGITSNQARVGETMYRLTMQPDYYKKVDLRYTQSQNQPGQKSPKVEFELAASLTELPDPKKGDADATKAQ